MADSQEWAKKYPLHNAVKYLNVEKLRILLTEKLDINGKNDEGYPLLVLACEQDRMDSLLRLLIDRKDIDPLLTNNKGFNALHSLAFRGNMYWIMKLLERFPQIPVDAETNKKDTALILAAKRNHDEVIQFLHDKGANINHQNAKKYSALHFTANNGYVESTQKLIELGAQVNIYDNFKITPLMKSVSWGFLDLSILLLKNKAETELVNEKNKTALIYAIRNNKVDLVRILLENNANPNHLILKKGILYQTALSSACMIKNVDIIKLLIKHGASIKDPSDINKSLIWTCITHGTPECLQELLNAGIHVDGTGKNYIDLAKKHDRYDMVRLLVRHIAAKKTEESRVN